jgi:2-polyprenyl-3-methyl-5-hydroxy-6-metoxy-1,4-benzoquinol methylase
MDVLDFGCGTGLLALQLLSRVRSVTGVDSSQGMINVFRAKIADRHLSNAHARFLDIDRGDTVPGRYHLIVSSMTFHHVCDIARLLERLRGALHPSGYLAVADLDLDDGLFHEDSRGVFHPGFDRDELRRVLAAAGFEDIRLCTASRVMKQGRDGKQRTFTVFLATGRNKA